MDGFRARLLGGMQRWNLGTKLSAEGYKRFFSEFLPKLHTTKHHILQQNDEKSWYLVYVGTRPQSRKRGYARKLVEHTLKDVSCSSERHSRSAPGADISEKVKLI